MIGAFRIYPVNRPRLIPIDNDEPSMHSIKKAKTGHKVFQTRMIFALRMNVFRHLYAIYIAAQQTTNRSHDRKNAPAPSHTRT